MKHLLILLALFAFVVCQDRAQIERRETFEIVWSRVNDKFYDLTFNGVDWNKVKTDYAPKVEQVKDDAEFYALMTQMLGELNASHFGIIGPGAIDIDEVMSRKGDGETGLVVRDIGGKAVVAQVADGSAAEKAGIKPGFEIVKIDSSEVARLRERLYTRKEREPILKFLFAMAIESRMSGKTGDKIELECIDLSGVSKTIEIELQRPRGELVRFAELPPIRAIHESKKLPNGMGYVRFNIFLMPLLEPVKKAIAEHSAASGLIIDLRGNMGGLGAMAMPIAGMLFKERKELGAMKMRTGEIRFLAYPQEQYYGGPVAILVDETSASTSEILAAGLQELSRAIVVGNPSAGAVLPSVVERLPNGARLQYAFADFRTPKGVLLEGKGVKPDVVVNLTKESLSSGKDPVLEAAIEALSKKQ